jgi:hypothetical protein
MQLVGAGATPEGNFILPVFPFLLIEISGMFFTSLLSLKIKKVNDDYIV